MYFTNIETNINDTGAVVNEFIRLFVSLGPVGSRALVCGLAAESGWCSRFGGRLAGTTGSDNLIRSLQCFTQ